MSNFNNSGLGDGGLSKARDKQLGSAVINASGQVTGLFKGDNQAPHPGQPIATQDNILVPREMAEQLAAINDIEEQYLKTIHARYCIPRALEINLAADISRYYPSKLQDRNYYEYWYKFGTPAEMFLMSRRVSVVDNNVMLDIKYNVKLARDGEND